MTAAVRTCFWVSKREIDRKRWTESGAATDSGEILKTRRTEYSAHSDQHLNHGDAHPNTRERNSGAPQHWAYQVVWCTHE